MSILDGRAAVQERLNAIDQERAALVAILDGYDRLAAIQQPEQVIDAGSAVAGPHPPAPVTSPERKHKRETYVCSRCPMAFKTKGWRDRHQAKHPPIPEPNGYRQLAASA